MKLYNVKKSLYLEIDANQIGLGTELPQVGDDMNFKQDKVPNNTILQPIAFASKNVSSAKQKYSNIEWEALEYYMARRNSITTVLPEKSM